MRLVTFLILSYSLQKQVLYLKHLRRRMWWRYCPVKRRTTHVSTDCPKQPTAGIESPVLIIKTHMHVPLGETSFHLLKRNISCMDLSSGAGFGR